MSTATTPKADPVYARRGYSPATGERVTFTSWDRADNAPWGWVNGWFEDGHLFEGHALIHTTEPSWRVREPVALVSAYRKVA